jgi:serine/threonine-protein kinase RsbW
VRRRKPTCELSIASDTALLGLVRDVTREFSRMCGFDEATSSQIALAVDEATTNVFEHAYHGARDRAVGLRFDERAAEVRIEIVDSGNMVDPRDLPRVDIERFATERRTGGLGVHLMERIMDQVTFRRVSRRNVCCMVKSRSPQGARGDGQ